MAGKALGGASDSMLRISEDYLALQRDMHVRYDYGVGMAAGECADMIHGLDVRTVLDYGSGQGHLKPLLDGYEVEEYDPAIEGKDTDPARADIVVCADVMEHIEPELLGNVLLHIYSLAR